MHHSGTPYHENIAASPYRRLELLLREAAAAVEAAGGDLLEARRLAEKGLMVEVMEPCCRLLMK